MRLVPEFMKIYHVVALLATVAALWCLPSCREAYGNEEMEAAEEIMEIRRIRPTESLGTWTATAFAADGNRPATRF